MPLLNVAPTKSNLLALARQLAFAEEGYDLLEQKRQILIFELMARLKRARELEQRVDNGVAQAHAALREATLDAGAAALDRAAAGARAGHGVAIDTQHLMGLRIPRVTAAAVEAAPAFGPGGTTAMADVEAAEFAALLPLLAERAGLETAVLRLAHELRKTQRRCNALVKLFIPDYRETIAYIRGTLEERERESFVILKMIRGRLRA